MCVALLSPISAAAPRHKSQATPSPPHERFDAPDASPPAGAGAGAAAGAGAGLPRQSGEPHHERTLPAGRRLPGDGAACTTGDRRSAARPRDEPGGHRHGPIQDGHNVAGVRAAHPGLSMRPRLGRRAGHCAQRASAQILQLGRAGVAEDLQCHREHAGDGVRRPGPQAPQRHLDPPARQL
eukprot:scaffold4501_cov320-Pinguiococcus_pyrenoidosus.AAC.3